MRSAAIGALLLVLLVGCFGARRTERRYYVLHLAPPRADSNTRIQGLLRVRDLDAESTYDKFQIVVRKNPYELSYRDGDVWAVKPNRMISDLLARRLQAYGLFSDVNRELGAERPDYRLGGDLHAVELYDSGDKLYAHLAISLSLANFRTGDVMWSYSFDERRDVPSLKFSHAVRTLSELLDEAATAAFVSLTELGEPREIEPHEIKPRENDPSEDADEPPLELRLDAEVGARSQAGSLRDDSPLAADPSNPKEGDGGSPEAIFVPEAAMPSSAGRDNEGP